MGVSLPEMEGRGWRLGDASATPRAAPGHLRDNGRNGPNGTAEAGTRTGPAHTRAARAAPAAFWDL